MLNELLTLERGAQQAGLDMVHLHPDVKDCGSIPTLIVSLDPKGRVASVGPLPRDVEPWTLRDGQHNSFPFVQPKSPLLALSSDDERRQKAVDKKANDRRASLFALAEKGRFSSSFGNWPGPGLLCRLRERRKQLAALDGTDASVVPATITRFLLACDPSADGDPARLLEAVMRELVAGLRRTAQDDWFEAGVALLLGKFNSKKGDWECNGGLLFDADIAPVRIFDSRVAIQVSRALLGGPGQRGAKRGGVGVCGLKGHKVRLLSDNFPQPNLPVLGQTFLFAKNKDIPANDRYGRFGAESMAVGEDAAIDLAAALRAVTAKKRLGVTWRSIPGEASTQKDLLLAFVEAAHDAPAAGILAERDAEDDFSEETAGDASDTFESVAAFEKRTERMMGAIRGKIEADFRQTPVHVAILRKVDPANRKVVYAGSPTVAELYDAAIGWVAGERNVPPWLKLAVLHRGEGKPRPMAPPHVAPLGVIPLSRQLFIRGGVEQTKVVGVPASETLALFLAPTGAEGGIAARRAHRFVRMVLTRRGVLLLGTAHAKARGFESLRNFDRREALRAVTVLGLLLHKLGRMKEVYMNDTAFKLGQLLAAADVVHAGYCADVRGGNMPPSLLGNQVFTMAQSAPARALATLCRRWKPYDGWAKKAVRERGRIDALANSGKAEDRQRGWDIRRALRHAREMRPLADGLATSLANCEASDTFRAELLLGYIAGLPKAQAEDTNETSSTTDVGKEEG